MWFRFLPHPRDGAEAQSPPLLFILTNKSALGKCCATVSCFRTAGKRRQINLVHRAAGPHIPYSIRIVHVTSDQ